MNSRDINEKIAQLCKIVGRDEYGPIYKSREGWVRDCPDFCNDLNAMHEAERCILDMGDGYGWLLSHTFAPYVWHSTAYERAMAFIDLHA